jgi:hypothetical protein
LLVASSVAKCDQGVVMYVPILEMLLHFMFCRRKNQEQYISSRRYILLKRCQHLYFMMYFLSWSNKLLKEKLTSIAAVNEVVIFNPYKLFSPFSF